MKILIVDDVASNRKVLELYLVQYGVCTAVENGGLAIEEFSKSLEENDPFNLICLDLIMPEKDGVQVLSEVRKLEVEFGVLPSKCARVFFVTTLDDPSKIKPLLKDPLIRHLEKPVNKLSISKALEELGFK